MHRARSPSSIGIYLDENYISAVVLTDGAACSALPKTPAQITFTNSGIKVGTPDGTGNNCSYWLYDVVKKSPEQRIRVQVQGQTFTLTLEDVMTCLFLEVSKTIQTNGRIDKIEKASLSIPFFLTSLEKERLKFSMERAGFTSIRIIPSTLAAAVTYGHNQRMSPAQVQQIIIIHATYRTFCIAGLKVEYNRIEPLEIIRPQKPEDDGFYKIHKRLYRNHPLSCEELNLIKWEYQHCLNLLRNRYPNGTFVIQREREPTELDKLIYSTLPGGQMVQTMYLSNEPLVGGAILANKTFGYLKCFSNIIVKIEEEAKNARSFPGIASSAGKVMSVTIPIPYDNVFTVSEETEGRIYPIGRFRVPVQSGKKGPASISCLTDEDGLISVQITYDNGFSNGALLRENGFRSSPSDLQHLKNLYNAGVRSNQSYMQASESNAQEIAKINISSDPMETIQQALENATDEGLAHYRKRMKELTDKGKPFTEKNITEFHENLQQAILRTFDETFKVPFTAPVMLQANPKCKQWFKEARDRLESGTSTLLSVSMKRYEVQIERVISKMEECMLEMESLYEERMEKKERLNIRNTNELQKFHDEQVAELQEEIRDSLQQNNLQFEDRMLKELEDSTPVVLYFIIWSYSEN
ncbi:unnamed protein product [Allacma fusca]|uniref:Uncharacterized protein n=1 Tax=Allacma fusca TaxID=39272 RepID=A0A8J2PEF6_9HEXA|nr:unnamed protein product [Allacma fusca]